MPTMMHLLLLALISGSLQMPAHAGESGPDYDYGDESVSRPPSNLAKPTAPALIPYFEQKDVVVYVQPNMTSVKLECPVKNYDAVGHQILWYRDDSLVSNGKEPIGKIYSLDSQYILTVPVANATGHNFSCRVMPSDVRRHITIKPAASGSRSSAPTKIWMITVDCMIVGAFTLIHKATARF